MCVLAHLCGLRCRGRLDHNAVLLSCMLPGGQHLTWGAVLQAFDVLVLARHVWAVWGSAQDSMHRFKVPVSSSFPSVILNPPPDGEGAGAASLFAE